MNTMTCTDCHRNVRRSDAHLRSVSLELVAICQPCMVLRVRWTRPLVAA